MSVCDKRGRDFLASFSGPPRRKSEAVIDLHSSPLLLPKACSVWQWFHFLLSKVSNDKTPLIINLDETSIRTWYPPRLGLKSRRQVQRGQPPRGRHSSRGQQRRAFTHVALICDDPSLQPLLPQILLVNEHTAPLYAIAGWSSLKGCNTHLWRAKSAWVNRNVFKLILAHIGDFAKTHAKDRQVILIMDALGVHCSEPVLAAARRHKIWVCIIPASMTSLLQPLDTHVFARFKLYFRMRLHEMMQSGANKDLEILQVLRALMLTIKGVLQRHEWAPVFKQNGFGKTSGIRKSLLQQFGLHDQPCISSELPSLGQFQSCFPKGREIAFMELLGALLPESERPPPVTAGPRPCAVPDSLAKASWVGRLRPRKDGKAMPPSKGHVLKTKSAPVSTASSSGGPTKTMATTEEGVPLPSLKKLKSFKNLLD